MGEIMKTFKKLLFTLFLIICGNAFAHEVSVKGLNTLQWKNYPYLRYSNEILNNQDVVNISILIEADEKGRVTSAHVVESSQNLDLDSMVVSAVKRASFYPYQENGIYYPIRAIQPFQLKPNNKTIWDKLFNIFKN